MLRRHSRLHTQHPTLTTPLSNQATIVVDLYEYRTAVFLAKAYVATGSDATALDRFQQTAKPANLAGYGIKLTDELNRVLQLVAALRPPAVAEVFRTGTRRTTTLPGLLSEKSKDRPKVIRHIQHRLDELLRRCREQRIPVTLAANTRAAPKAYLVPFRQTPIEPLAKFTFDEATGFTYELRLNDGAGGNALPRHHDWKVITNSPTPGWLVYDNRLTHLGQLSGNHIRPFLTRDEVRVSPDEARSYWKDFVVKYAKQHAITAEGFDYQTITSPEHLKISLRLHPFERRYQLQPQFTYGRKSFNPADSALTATDYNLKPPYFLRRIVRDTEMEQQLLSVLQVPELSQVQGAAAYEVTDGDAYAAVDWLLANQDRLLVAGVQVDTTLAEGAQAIDYESSIELELQQDNDWFDLRAVITIGPFQVPFQKLAKQIRKGERPYVLPDGTLFLLPEEWFNKYGPALQLATITRGQVRLRRSQAPVLARAGLDVPAAEVNLPAGDFQTSELLQAQLRPYQLEGVRWLVGHYRSELGACLADDMGLGKTLQTIATLLHAKDELASVGEAAGAVNGVTEQSKVAAPAPQLDLFAAPAADEVFLSPLQALIILPASLVYNWRAELEKFAPTLTVGIHTGSNRSKDARVLRRYDVLLTTYQTALRDILVLRKIEFTYVVLDESQQIKNRQSKIFQALNSLHATHRISLSGTPIENSLSDLWAQMQFINPGLLGGYTFFKKAFQEPIERHDDEAKKEQLRQLVAPHLLRRTKAEVAPDLPDLEMQVCYCEMDTTQRKAYEREKSAARNALLGQGADGSGAYHLRVIQTLTRLRQLANHPALLAEAVTDKAGSGKFTEVLEQWDTVRRAGHKVLIFSSMVRHLELFRQQLQQAGEPFAWITGAVSSEQRAKEVHRFQTDPSVQTFFISIKAGGTGLNLTAADYVFILDPWWNPSIEDQAIARAHRIGRQGKVLARRFLTKGTIEEKIHLLQQRKRQLAADIISAEGKLGFDLRDLDGLLS